MKATDLLKRQHAEVKELFEKLGRAEPAYKPGLRTEIADALAAHAAIEQELFYPAAGEALGDVPILCECLEEHGVIEFCLVKLLGSSPRLDVRSFDAKATVLMECVLHHVAEEENDLFKRVEEAMDEESLVRLGSQLKKRFEECKEMGHRKLLARDADQWALSSGNSSAHRVHA